MEGANEAGCHDEHGGEADQLEPSELEFHVLRIARHGIMVRSSVFRILFVVRRLQRTGVLEFAACEISDVFEVEPSFGRCAGFGCPTRRVLTELSILNEYLAVVGCLGQEDNGLTGHFMFGCVVETV